MSVRTAATATATATATSAAKAPRARITVRAMVLAFLTAVLAVSAIYPVRLYVQQRREISTLQSQTAQLQAIDSRYSEQIRQLQNPKYLEQLARDCLGMVRKGETAFVVIPKHGQPKADACIPSADTGSGTQP